MLEASLREQRQPVSAEQARQALDALPASTQGAVQSLVADHGPRARQHLAYQALGEWTPRAARGDPHAGRGQPGGPSAGVLRWRRVDVGVRRERRPADRSACWVGRRDSCALASPAARLGTAGTATSARKPQDQPRPDRWGRLVNPAPAHLEAKLRFGWDFTVGQIAAMVGGILVGFAWANWLSPIHGIGAAVTGVYVGGLPVAAGFVASQTEFDLGAVVRLGGALAPRRRAVRGRRRHAAPGTSWSASTSERAATSEPLAVLDPELLWGDAVTVPHSMSRPLAAGGRR